MMDDRTHDAVTDCRATPDAAPVTLLADPTDPVEPVAPVAPVAPVDQIDSFDPSDTRFEALYRRHYQHLPRALLALPLLLLGLFLTSVIALFWLRTDKIIELEGQILPREVSRSLLKQRGFVQEQHLTPGSSVKRGQLLARILLDDGAISEYRALQDGVIVDSGIKALAEGPYPEATLIASIVDPRALRLQLALPARWRGSVPPGNPVRYRFDSLLRSQPSRVLEQEVRLAADGSVHYLLHAELAVSEQKLANLGRKLPVKLLVGRTSLLDYFFNP